VPEAGAKRNVLFACCYGLHHLPAPFSEKYQDKKSRAPQYHLKIFRQPGCLNEILKAFRPILADG
jgi:hypothetical protein